MNKELEDQFYERVALEIANNNYQPAPMARAVEKSAGNPDLAKSLYVKFRIEQLAVSERRQAADRAKAIAEEKITQKKSDQLRQQREAKEAEAARAAKRAEDDAARAVKRAEDEERWAAFNDSVLVCFVLIVLCLVSTLLFGWAAICSDSDSAPGLFVFLFFGLFAIYGITWHHFEARKQRMIDARAKQISDPPSRKPPDC